MATTVLHAAVWLSEALFLWRRYDFPLPGAEAANLPALAGAPQGMPLWGAVLATWLIRLAGSLFFSALLFTVTVRAATTVGALLTGVGLSLALFALDSLLPPALANLSPVAVMAGDGMAVLSGPALLAALTYFALTVLLFGAGEYSWLKLLGKPYF